MLNFILPPEIYVGDRVTGHVHASVAGSSESYPVALRPATLTAVGNATLDRTSVRLAEAFGRFNFTLNDDKPGDPRRERQRRRRTRHHPAQAVRPPPRALLGFPKTIAHRREEFLVRFRPARRREPAAQQEVARIDLAPGDAVKKTGNDHRVIYRIDGLPPAAQLDRGNIRGIFFDVKTLGFTNAKSNARLTVVMQSPADYWMVLGSTPLDGTTDWRRVQLDVTRESYIKAMSAAYNVWFVLDGDDSSQGTVCLDRIGFMVR